MKKSLIILFIVIILASIITIAIINNVKEYRKETYCYSKIDNFADLRDNSIIKIYIPLVSVFQMLSSFFDTFL